MGITLETKHNKSFISLLIYSSLVVLSLLIGFLIFSKDNRGAAIYQHSIMTGSISFTMLLASSLIPLAVSVFLMRVGWRPGLYVLAAFKTLSFSICITSVFVAFPKSGWLIQIIALLSQWFEMCIYHWYWMRILIFHRSFSYRDCGICAAAVLLSVIFDYFLICPFTASLFIFK